MSGERQAATVERALSVLAALGNGPLGFARLVEVVDCGAASLSRLLKGLVSAGLIEGGGGASYRSTAQARSLGQAIAGSDQRIAATRRELAALSEHLGTGCAWFQVEATGVRCLTRHLVPEAVGYISEGSMRTELRGHGCVVAACAASADVCEWHGAQLRVDLGWDEGVWETQLDAIRANGFFCSHGLEGAPGQGPGPLETLARLSIPQPGPDGYPVVLTATGHGLSAGRVFPEPAIEAALLSAQRLADIWAD
jgi:hypothetical protein